MKTKPPPPEKLRGQEAIDAMSNGLEKIQNRLKETLEEAEARFANQKSPPAKEVFHVESDISIKTGLEPEKENQELPEKHNPTQ